MRQNFWFWLRLVLLGGAFVFGLLSPFVDLWEPETTMEGPVFVFAVVLPLAFFPFALLFVMGLQALNPFSPKKWRRASWHSNFVDPRHPLPFFHVAAYLSAALGGGVLCGVLLAAGSVDLGSLSMISTSAGLLLGVRLCEDVFGCRFEE